MAQVIFLVFHSIINNSALDYYKQAPYDLDDAAYLVILPNYLLADLYQPLPVDLMNNCIAAV